MARLLLPLLLPALIGASSLDPETSRLLAEVNGGLAADVASSDSVGQHSISRHDYVGRYPGELPEAGYGATLPFGARTRPITEHPLNEHFRYLEKARREQYGDIYTKHPKLQYKPKYYAYPKHEGVKYQKPKYEELKYGSPKYESYKYEKPKYKELKYKSHKYPRPEYKEYVPKHVYEEPTYHQEYETYVAPESPHFFEPPPPHFSSAPRPHPLRYEPPVVSEADYPVLPPPPTSALHHLPPPPPPPPRRPFHPGAVPETFHYTEEHHVTESYPVPAPYPAYRETPPRGHRAGKALDRFSFNPDPYIETIAIAYHENERNFNSRHRQPKHHVPQYEEPHYPGPHEYRPPHVQKYAPRAPKYDRHVPPHASKYVAPHAKQHAVPEGRGYGHLVGGYPTPERTVTLTPYRVQVGTLYGLSAASSSLSETVVQDDKAEGREAKSAEKQLIGKEKKSNDGVEGAEKV